MSDVAPSAAAITSPPSRPQQQDGTVIASASSSASGAANNAVELAVSAPPIASPPLDLFEITPGLAHEILDGPTPADKQQPPNAGHHGGGGVVVTLVAPQPVHAVALTITVQPAHDATDAEKTEKQMYKLRESGKAVVIIAPPSPPPSTHPPPERALSPPLLASTFRVRNFSAGIIVMFIGLVLLSIGIALSMTAAHKYCDAFANSTFTSANSTLSTSYDTSTRSAICGSSIQIVGVYVGVPLLLILFGWLVVNWFYARQTIPADYFPCANHNTPTGDACDAFSCVLMAALLITCIVFSRDAFRCHDSTDPNAHFGCSDGTAGLVFYFVAIVVFILGCNFRAAAVTPDPEQDEECLTLIW